MTQQILLVPSVLKGNGSGHLIRALGLAREFGEGAAVYIPEAPAESLWSAAEISLAYSHELEGIRLVGDLSTAGQWDLVVLDRRSTSLAELAFWETFGPVVALDEGGAARKSCAYLIDILPRLEARNRFGKRGLSANESDLSFLKLPQHRRAAPPEKFDRVLLSFGGEDPAGLCLGLARLLLSRGLVRPENLTLVGGPLSRLQPGGIIPRGLDGVLLLGPVQNLKEHLLQYDLVITSFGLTAFEAAWAGCGVILLNPSSYHRRLALQVGFPEIGVGKPDLKALETYLAAPELVLAPAARLFPGEMRSLASFVLGLAPSGAQTCPRCGGKERSALWRNRRKTYFRCDSCGMLYLSRFSSERETPYKKEYFFEEYRRQYGRTYLEDWPALTTLAESRLDRLEAVAGKSLGRRTGLSLLDVGCAYGPFMAAAAARGHEAYGLDVAEDAARYVREHLGLPAISGDFLDPGTARSFGAPFDCLSLWFVIEHFADLDKALRIASSLLRPGGVLALATPSGEGVSARFDPPGFFERSPEDHFTIWEPSRAEGILKTYGFRIERLRITGHHPERFPLAGGCGDGFPGRCLRGALGFVSRIFGFGDTFEIYAVRERAEASQDYPAGTPATRRVARAPGA